jgi:hypothetical protein
MPEQVVRMLRRAARAQVLGRGAEHAAHREEPARHELLGARREDLQRDVEALLHRIDDRVAHEEVEVDLRIALLELGQQVRQVAEHEAGQRMHAQQARPACRPPRASGRRPRWCG